MIKYIIPGLIAIYLTVSAFFWGWLLLDVAFNDFTLFKYLHFTLPSEPIKINLLKIAMYSLIGGAFGGMSYGMMNLQRHTTLDGFKLVFLGDYLFRPFGAAILAVVVFALIRGGILTILGADASNARPSVASSLSSFGIGYLSGFSSVEVIKTFSRLSKNIFGDKEERERDDGKKSGGDNSNNETPQNKTKTTA
jgi:hypothetical protein